jgi:hypothetical protein
MVACSSGGCAPAFRHMMYELGQTEKNSVRTCVFRFALELGYCLTQSACLKRAPTGLEYPPGADVPLLITKLLDSKAESDDVGF